MSVLASRVRAAILRIGDPFTVSGDSRIGRFRVISYGRALQYATPAEAGGYSKPIRLAIVPHDDSTAVGNTVVWSGLSLLVQKTDVLTCRGETVARVLILA